MIPDKDNIGVTHKCPDVVYKELVSSLLDLIVLRLIDREPKHGYQIVKDIHEKFGVYFRATLIYHILANFEHNGFVHSKWDLAARRQRKKFIITYKGKLMIESFESELNIICRALNDFEISTPIS